MTQQTLPARHWERVFGLGCILISAILAAPATAGPPSTDYAEFYSFPINPTVADLSEASAAPPAIGQQQLEALLRLVRSTFLQQLAAEDVSNAGWPEAMPALPVHLSFRIGGSYLTEGIGFEADLRSSIGVAIDRALALLARRLEPRQIGPLNAQSLQQLGVELTLLHSPKALNDRDLTALESAIERGVHAVGLQSKTRFSLFSNSKSLIHNYSTGKLMKRLSESLGESPKAYSKADNRLFRFDALQVVQRRPSLPVETLYRGDRLIAVEEVRAGQLDDFIDAMGSWLLNQLRRDGRMEYKYMPSRGQYSTSNNMIRQWMASLALAELAHATGDQRYALAWQSNVAYNLDNYYRESDDYGYILFKDKAKLGAAAIATMAIRHDPIASGAPIAFERQSNMLAALLDELREPDGSFRTFLIPANRNDNQSFYSGEALLAIAQSLPDDVGETALAKFKQSMRYYMDYYRSTNRYTPFVPWHTMAYWHLYRLTGDEDYKKAIYELNDWLICIQELRDQAPPDSKGRFFVPEFSYNGPPHASSTAVYVEGLAYAYDLARSEQDAARANAYLNSIRWGLRNLMQLQYRPRNAFYVSKLPRVLGGIRTRLYDNQLRIDNTQHAVMAALAVKRFVAAADLQRPLPETTAFRAAALRRFTDTGQASADQRKRPGGGNRAVVLLGGDTQLGRFTERWAERKGYEHGFRGIGGELQGADALITNLECVVADSGSPVLKQGSKVWHLRAGPHMLKVFPKHLTNVVSVANNHSMDYGAEALMEMVSTHLPSNNILFAGGGRDMSAAARPAEFSLNGIDIALFSFTTIEQEFAAANDRPGYNWISEHDLVAFRNRLQQVLEENPTDTDLQVLAIHWGKNHEPTARPMHRQMARAAVELGFDLIVGHQAHVNHGIELYRGAPIFYDLGNFLVDFKFSGWDGKSIMPKLTLSDRGVETIELIPVSLRDKAVNIAIGVEADSILERIEELSGQYGTRLSKRKGRGFVVLRSDTGAR